eukprot:12436185-Ditylum_brightwellii.AAC.1
MTAPLLTREEADGPFVCRNAILGILHIGRRRYKSAAKNTIFEHALTGKTGVESNRGKQAAVLYHNVLHDYFAVLKGEGVPFATRAIREETGT